jgi:predicted O-methyltransferase YrrM
MKGIPLNDGLYNYILDTFVSEDEALKQVVRVTEKLNFPLIQISPELGKFLYLLAKLINAENILEVGTLTGYSTIWLARALTESGRLITLELNAEHAKTAKENFNSAGLGDKIKLIEGYAADSLKNLHDEKFDMAFIDADKENYPLYYDLVKPLIRKGGLITADNTLRHGEVIDPDCREAGTLGVKEYNRKAAGDTGIVSFLVPISDGLTISLVR